MLAVSFAIVLAMIAVPIECGLSCCYPSQMEGARYFLEQKKTKYFMADYNRGYIFETLTIGGPNKTIIDLIEEKVYTIAGDKCSERAIREPGLFDPCLSDEDAVRYNARLGQGDNAIAVDFFDYQVGRYSVFKAVKFGSDGCFPVATQTRIGHHTLTTLYHNTVGEISFPAIFSELEKCKVDVRGGNAGGNEGGGSSSSSSDEDH